jgi:hypothetical protein
VFHWLKTHLKDSLLQVFIFSYGKDPAGIILQGPPFKTQVQNTTTQKFTFHFEQACARFETIMLKIALL